jgi:predicted peptidase
MFLHGSGERGNDNEAQLLHGGSLFLQDSLRKNYPAIIIFPQCPKDSSWAYMEHHYDSVTKKMSFAFPFQPEPTIPAKLVKELMDSLVHAKAVDKKRIYIGGLSMGGFGTYNMLARYPRYFAAAIPICGGGDTLMARRFHRIPGIWIFHGDKDPAVNVEYSRAYFRTLQGLHANVKYTEYPGVGHNSWDNAFAEKDLFRWLFSQEK